MNLFNHLIDMFLYEHCESIFLSESATKIEPDSDSLLAKSLETETVKLIFKKHLFRVKAQTFCHQIIILQVYTMLRY